MQNDSPNHSDGFTGFKNRLVDTTLDWMDDAKEYAEVPDRFVRENTWAAVGIAAAVGFAIGWLVGGSDED